MSKTWEHYDLAAHHHARAAHDYKQAAKYVQAEEHEEAIHHAYLAHGHSQTAMMHENAAATLHAHECDGLATASPVEGSIRKEVELDPFEVVTTPIA